MNFITASLVFLSVVFSSITSFAGVSERMSAELDKYESFISIGTNNYKVEERFQSAKVVFLKEWPVEVQRSIYLALWKTEAPPLVIDMSELTAYQRSFGHEYGYTASIIRSATIEVEGEKVYLAIYKAFGGEWGREKTFLEYYFLDEKGELIRMGTNIN